LGEEAEIRKRWGSAASVVGTPPVVLQPKGVLITLKVVKNKEFGEQKMKPSPKLGTTSEKTGHPIKS